MRLLLQSPTSLAWPVPRLIKAMNSFLRASPRSHPDLSGFPVPGVIPAAAKLLSDPDSGSNNVRWLGEGGALGRGRAAKLRAAGGGAGISGCAAPRGGCYNPGAGPPPSGFTAPSDCARPPSDFAAS